MTAVNILTVLRLCKRKKVGGNQKIRSSPLCIMWEVKQASFAETRATMTILESTASMLLISVDMSVDKDSDQPFRAEVHQVHMYSTVLQQNYALNPLKYPFRNGFRSSACTPSSLALRSWAGTFVNSESGIRRYVISLLDPCTMSDPTVGA